MTALGSACLFSTTLLAVLATAGARQDDGERVDGRAEVAALRDRLADHLKRKGKEDEEAIAVIDRLAQEFPLSGRKDRASIVKALDRCFRAKRPKEIEPGVPDDRLYVAAAIALGGMGPASVKPLIGLLGHKDHKRNLRLQGRIASSLGKTRDPKGVKPLLGLLTHKDRELQVAGAEALANYAGADAKTRKEIFKALLDTMMAQKAKKDVDTTDVEAWERWNAISGAIIASLQRLSDHDEREPDAWQRWWNKNKRADWGADNG